LFENVELSATEKFTPSHTTIVDAPAASGTVAPVPVLSVIVAVLREDETK